MSPFLAELIGTTLLVFLGTSTVANVLLKDTKGFDGGWFTITTGWALAVFVAVSFATPFSGAHLNPAVSLALAIAGKFDWVDLPGYVSAQLLGAGTGAFFTWALYFNHFNRTENPDIILGVFSSSPAIRSPFANLFSEMTGTFVLVFVIFYFTDAKIIATNSLIGLGSVGAIPVAFLVWVIGIALGGTTGYASNPARDLMPRIMHTILPIKHKGKSDWQYAWVPIFGPFIGAILASFAFLILQ
ncbi:MAG: MIP/aquaporin family protein [Cytophagales bacterium]